MKVTIRPEAPDVDEADEEDALAPPEPTADQIAESVVAQLDYEGSLLRAADVFRALPLDHLSVSGLDQRGPDARVIARRHATLLAGCLVHAAEVVTDGLFEDVVKLREAQERSKSIAVDDLWVLSALPRRFAQHYDALFAQKFLVVLTDMTRRITAGWEPLACVAQELAVRVWLNQVEVVAEGAGIELEDGWREQLEEYLFEDLDHEYLYDPALDGFEADDKFGPPGMTSMRFEEWFVPFNDERHLPTYALDSTRKGHTAPGV